MKRLNGILLAMCALSPLLEATNTSSVFSPEVTPGSRSLEYRFSAVEQDGPDAWAHRIHYQQAINDAWQWRLITAFADPAGGAHEYRYGRLEMMWQFIESEDAGWDSAIRYEFQVADGDDEPSRARVVWSAKWNFTNDLEFRSNLLTGREFGPYASEGWMLETRTQLTAPVSPRIRVGMEMFNDFNDSRSLGSWSEQGHQLGPVLKAKIGSDCSLLASWLFGVSSNAPDNDFRLHLIYSF